MKITVLKLTDDSLMRLACSFTSNSKSRMTLDKIYHCEHSPMRTQVFWVEMYDIPTFVSVHLVRHKIGVEHFVKSNREDRGGDGEADRNTPVNHAMLINAQALVAMARKRLCFKAHHETQKVMWGIHQAVFDADSALAAHMVADCVYRNGCYELQTCGYYENTLKEQML